MPANYVLLEKITVGAAGASSVTFSGIPQTGYTDLVVKISARSTASAAYEALKVSYNGSTSSYTAKQIYGTGSSAVSNNYTDAWVGFMNAATSTSNTFSSTEVYIPNYTSSNNKSSSVDFAQEDNASTAISGMLARLWSNTSAITSIGITPETGNFVAGSTFYLYGVAKLGTTPVIVPYATGGDTIMTDGTYWYHAFLSSGTFTPTKGLSADVLVVAGGGGGGTSGGGGAGGLLAHSAQSLATTGYTVTIGAGGAGQAAGSVASNGNNGSNSQFAALTASVGGGGGGTNDGSGIGRAGNSGGSGGGGSLDVSSVNRAGGAATSGQGNAGGSGTGAGSAFAGGGGGGAGAVGSNASGANAGAGGAGTNTYSSWLSVTGTGVSGFIAGGGGGGGDNSGTVIGAGGSGGGGFGSYTSPAASGVANTGSGGGGGKTGTTGAGGSGIVIVRYAV